jgi:putative membrane protein
MLQIKYAIAGFLMGIAELIPGISGSTIAVVFKIYKNLMTILSELKWRNLSLNFFKLSEIFQFKLLLPLIGSMLISILLFATAIDYLLNNYEQNFFTALGFLMILLSIQVANFFKDVFRKPILFPFLMFGAAIGFFLNSLGLDVISPNLLYLYASGLLAFAFFLIPGISGSALLIVLGIYGIVIQSISQLNFEVLLPFGLGCITSLVLLPKFILAVFLRYEEKLLLFFAGLIFSSGYFLIA